MAKRCEVCKRLFSDSQPLCPYCKAPSNGGPEPDEEDVFASLCAEAT